MNLTSEKSSIGVQGIATLDAFLFIADSGNHRIQKLDMEGTFLLEFGGYGSTDGYLKNPWGVSTDGVYVYVTDTDNHRVQVYDLEGNFQFNFGEEGNEAGEFNQPRGIVVKNGWVYVVDSNNSRIQIFTLDGRFAMMFGEEGSGDGYFDHPIAIAISGSYLYIDDRGNDRVVIMQLNYVDPNYVPPPVVMPRNIKTTYSCKLGGLISSGLPGVYLPMKNMSARLAQGDISLNVTIPLTKTIEEQVTARANGILSIYQTFHKDDGTLETRYMFQAKLESARVYEGPRSGSIALVGRSRTKFGYFATIEIPAELFKTNQDGALRYRIAPLAWVWPENKIVVDGSTITVEKVTITLSPTSGTMEVTKKLIT